MEAASIRFLSLNWTPLLTFFMILLDIIVVWCFLSLSVILVILNTFSVPLNDFISAL